MVKTKCEICDRTFKNEESLAMHNQAIHTQKEVKKYSNKKVKNSIYIIIVLLILIGIGYLILSFIFSTGKYDTFAQCISDSGAKFYGAYWCPHCQDEKSLFGKSAKKLPYIECSLPNRGGQNALCNTSKIESYPTWEFADGSRSNYLTLTQLSEKTGCPLIEDN